MAIEGTWRRSRSKCLPRRRISRQGGKSGNLKNIWTARGTLEFSDRVSIEDFFFLNVRFSITDKVVRLPILFFRYKFHSPKDKKEIKREGEM